MNTYSYDLNGNLTQVNSVVTHTWDRANRLLSHGGIDYAYNGLGQRVSQTAASVATQYLLDVQPGLYKVLAATTPSGATRYIHDMRGIHSQQLPNSAWQHMITDGLGSVRSVLDNNPAMLESRSYSPYGNPIPEMQVGTPQTVYGFTGEPRDENGLLHLRARYLDPVMGVFLSLDPLETANRYSYVDANSINFIDPSGLGPCDPFGTAAPQTNMPCEQIGSGYIKSPGLSEAAIYLNWGILLTVACDSDLSWKEYYRSVINAAKAISSRIGDFKSVFGEVEFRLTPGSGKTYSAFTMGSTYVEWYNSGLSIATTGGKSPEENRTFNIVHELGHILAHRTNRELYNDALSDPSSISELLPSSALVSLTMEPQALIDKDTWIEKTADHFLFWIYNAIDSPTVEGDAGRAFAEGGLIVRDRNSGRYPFIFVGKNYSYTDRTWAESLAQTDPSVVYGVTMGFEYWLNIARANSYSIGYVI